MSGDQLLFLLAVAQLVVPRRWGAAPILAGACYLPIGTGGAGLEIGGFSFYSIRLLLAVALVRLLLRSERLVGPMNSLDKAMLIWSGIALASGLFYPDVGAALVSRAASVYTATGTYFVLRLLCATMDDAIRLCRALALLLIPLAIAMLNEKLTGTNYFARFGGVLELSAVRNDSIRAQGSFLHAITAGSVGAACLPLMAALWRTNRKTSVVGGLASLVLIFSTASSGPLASSALAVAASVMWKWRHRMRLLRWGAVLGVLALNMVMNAPVWFALSYIDLTGSSTSWHRAALIDAAVTHWTEWWLYGTSYTRHWLPYGVTWSGNHVDITNYYLRMGVDGGLPLMLSFIWVLSRGFSIVGLRAATSETTAADNYSAFVAWTFGASLFSHAASFFSLSYYDQSVLFLYLTLALIATCKNTIPLTAQSDS